MGETAGAIAFTSFIVVITLSLFGMCIYAGYLADHNKPAENDPEKSGGLYKACYALAIVDCLIYLISTISCPFIIGNMFNDTSNKNSSGGSALSIPLLIRIYWIVIYFNYKVSPEYDEYALCQTVFFFVILGLAVLACCSTCFVVLLPERTKSYITNSTLIVDNERDLEDATETATTITPTTTITPITTITTTPTTQNRNTDI